MNHIFVFILAFSCASLLHGSWISTGLFFQADANRTQAKPLVIVGKLINKDGSPKVGETVIGCLMKADKLTTYEVAYKEGQVTNPKAKTAKDASFQIRIDRAALKGYSFVAVGLMNRWTFDPFRTTGGQFFSISVDSDSAYLGTITVSAN